MEAILTAALDIGTLYLAAITSLLLSAALSKEARSDNVRNLFGLSVDAGALLPKEFFPGELFPGALLTAAPADVSFAGASSVF